MPFQIDLLREHHQQERERKTDPLRIGMLVLLLIGIGLVGFYTLRSLSVGKLQEQRNALAQQWAEKEPLGKQAAEEQVLLQSNLNTSQALVQRAENRFYWGTLLDILLRAVPADTQIRSLSGQVNKESGTVDLGFTGISAGAQPRQSAEKFRQLLIEKLSTRFSEVTAEFQSLDDDSLRVNLKGRTLETARFKIDVKLNFRNQPVPQEG